MTRPLMGRSRPRLGPYPSQGGAEVAEVGETGEEVCVVSLAEAGAVEGGASVCGWLVRCPDEKLGGTFNRSPPKAAGGCGCWLVTPR